MSVGKPPYDVYQMDHADILLSEVPKRSRGESSVTPVVQASVRTLAALAPKKAKIAEEDPLQVHDPWAPPGLSKRPTPAVNVEDIATKVENRVVASIQAQKLDCPDENMIDDGKFQELEAKVNMEDA